jgi:hypothetical protein
MQIRELVEDPERVRRTKERQKRQIWLRALASEITHYLDQHNDEFRNFKEFEQAVSHEFGTDQGDLFQGPAHDFPPEINLYSIWQDKNPKPYTGPTDPETVARGWEPPGRYSGT